MRARTIGSLSMSLSDSSGNCGIANLHHLKNPPPPFPAHDCSFASIDREIESEHAFMIRRPLQHFRMAQRP